MSEMLTTKEVSDLFGVTTRTVLNWANAGIIGTKLGGVWRFEPSEIESFKRNGRKKCQSTNVGVSGGSSFNVTESQFGSPLDRAINEWQKNTNAS